MCTCHSTLSSSVPPCLWLQSKVLSRWPPDNRTPLPSLTAQEYLIKVGNLSLGAVQMIGDLLNADAGYYLAFLETLRDFVSFQEPRWEVWQGTGETGVS